MTVLLEELRDSAQRDGVERFVVGAVIHQDGSALVVTRSELDDFLPGIDEVPSGGVEFGETLVTALNRELSEEVGFAAGSIDGDFLETFDYRSGSGKATRQFTVSVPLAGRAIRLSDEHVACRWVTVEDVGGTSCTLETRRVLDAWFAR